MRPSFGLSLLLLATLAAASSMQGSMDGSKMGSQDSGDDDGGEVEYSRGTLVAIGYDSFSRKNQFILVNPSNGKATVKETFSFDSGSWFSASFVVDADRGFAYAMATNTWSLYRFTLDGSKGVEKLGNISQFSSTIIPQSMILGKNGNLDGVAYHSTYKYNTPFTIDISKGDSPKVSFGNSFYFDTKSWFAHSLTGATHKTITYVFATSTSGALYRGETPLTGFNKIPGSGFPKPIPSMGAVMSLWDVNGRYNSTFYGIVNSNELHQFRAAPPANSNTSLVSTASNHYSLTSGASASTFTLDQVKQSAYLISSTRKLWVYDLSDVGSGRGGIPNPKIHQDMGFAIQALQATPSEEPTTSTPVPGTPVPLPFITTPAPSTTTTAPSTTDVVSAAPATTSNAATSMSTTTTPLPSPTFAPLVGGTPFIITAMMRISGDFTTAMISPGPIRRRLEEAILMDLSFHLLIDRLFITIDRLYLGSLVIEFTVNDKTGNATATVDRLDDIKNQEDAMNNTKNVYIAEGGDPTKFEVNSTSATISRGSGGAPPAQDGPSSSSNKVAIIAGSVAAAVVIIIIIVVVSLCCCCGGQKSNRQQPASNGWLAQQVPGGFDQLKERIPDSAGGVFDQMKEVSVSRGFDASNFDHYAMPEVAQGAMAAVAATASGAMEAAADWLPSAEDFANAPTGYTWDEDAGYFYNENDRYYFDHKTDEYYDPDSGLWFNNSTGEWYERV